MFSAFAKKLLISVIITFAVVVIQAQTPAFSWAKSLNGRYAWNNGNGITADMKGNVYTTGSFGFDSCDFDPGPDSFFMLPSDSDIFISKLDSTGKFAWAKKIGGAGMDIGESITTDKKGNIYVTGYFTYYADFNPGAGAFYMFAASGSWDAFVLKLDSAGNFIWARQFASNSNSRCYGNSIKVDSTGNIYSIGIFTGTTDFNPGSSTFNLTTPISWNVYISKLNAAGNFVWAKQIEGIVSGEFPEFTLDASGSIYLTSSYRNTLNFDYPNNTIILTPAYYYSDEFFIAKMDSFGGFTWVKSFGGADEDRSKGIAVDLSGNIYTTGWFLGQIDIDPDTGTFMLNSAGLGDAFILKTDNSGNFIWAKRFGEHELDMGKSILTDVRGNVYLLGEFQDSIDGNPGSGKFMLKGEGTQDVFFEKLDSSGNFLWAGSIGGRNIDYGADFFIDASLDIFTTGFYSDTTDFDPGKGRFYVMDGGPTGDLAAYMHKIKGCPPTASTLKVSACSSYTLNGKIYTASGNYQQVRDNFQGCDSIIRLNLKIWPKVYSFRNVSICTGDFYFFNGSKWISTGIYRDTLFNFRNCDSIVILNLTVNPVSDTLLYREICDNDPLIFNGNKLSISGIYKDTLRNYLNCDSVVTLNLKVKPTGDSTLYREICEGSAYFFNGSNRTVDGNYLDTLTNIYGCDSVVTLALSIKKKTYSIMYQAICTGDYYQFNGVNRTIQGTYKDTLVNTKGCDSVITLNLTVYTLRTTSLYEVICQGDEFVFNGTALKDPGIYFDTLPDFHGCDSIITLNLGVNPNTFSVINETVCKGSGYFFNGKNLTASGTYLDTLFNYLGCDSFITLNLSIFSINTGVSLSGRTITASLPGAVYQWLDCGDHKKPVNGQNGQKFLPSTNGSYAVMIQQGVCKDTSSCVTVKESIGNFNSYSVYPNPSKGLITISFKYASDDISFKLYNVISQLLIKETDIKVKQYELDISAYESGIYFLEINMSGNISYVKLVKN